MGILTELSYKRFIEGVYPLAFVSLDNCKNNGDLLKSVMIEIAKENYGDDFLEYLMDESVIGYPLTMIDKITPRPQEEVKNSLIADGLKGIDITKTKKNAFTAAFVNTEEKEYLVIEDIFPNGRPPLDEVGVIFSDRENVILVEKMKVSACLNPLHTCLAIFACLLGYRTIHEAVADEDLRNLLEILAYDEGLKAIKKPSVLDVDKFLAEVINTRFSNPYMVDIPQRIATDTSQKISVRFGETIKAFHEREELKTSDLKAIPLVIAGWFRYLLGLEDNGKIFKISDDPLLPKLLPVFAKISLGDEGPFESELKFILDDEEIFGMSLYEAALDKKILSLFERMLENKGSVRSTLKSIRRASK